MAVAILEDGLKTIHTLSAAAWLGALVYRVFVVDPKLQRLLGKGVEFEQASLHLAHGMRYVVMSALLVCGLSGFALVGLQTNPSVNWVMFMAGKTGVWLLAFALFVYISWVFWPKRVFAVATQWASIRRQGFVISLLMIGLAGLGFVLGQLGQSARLSS